MTLEVKCILQLRPFLFPKYDLRKHPNFKHTAEADKSNTFDAAEFISTKLTVTLKEQFTVYEADVPDEPIGGNEDILNYDDLDDPEAFA